MHIATLILYIEENEEKKQQTKSEREVKTDRHADMNSETELRNILFSLRHSYFLKVLRKLFLKPQAC